MYKRDIQDRNDIGILVRDFYIRVRSDQQLGPIFNKVLVSDEVWEHHFEKLIDFWEAILLKGSNYEGQPVAQHLWVDSQTGRSMGDGHFQNWLDIWHKTIDGNFSGTTSEIAKSSAISIAQTFYSKIMEIRKDIDPSLIIKKKFEY